MIKRVEVNYRGIFQKNLAKKIGSDIVMIASRMGQRAFSNGRYSDSPERNGIPCKYFAFVSPDLSEEELEAECGAKLEIDQIGPAFASAAGAERPSAATAAAAKASLRIMIPFSLKAGRILPPIVSLMRPTIDAAQEREPEVKGGRGIE